MNIKELKEQLKKEKDPEKFLKEFLKKSKDKKLIEEIKKLLEKKESWGESELERAVRDVHVERREPRLTMQMPEVEGTFEGGQALVRGVRPDLIVGKKEGADYGLKSGVKDYATGSAVEKLQGSSLVAEDAHLGNAETQGLIDKKMGSYDMRDKESSKYSESNIYEGTKRDSFVETTAFDDILGTDRDKKKKKLGDYV